MIRWKIPESGPRMQGEETSQINSHKGGERTFRLARFSYCSFTINLLVLGFLDWSTLKGWQPDRKYEICLDRSLWPTHFSSIQLQSCTPDLSSFSNHGGGWFYYKQNWQSGFLLLWRDLGAINYHPWSKLVQSSNTNGRFATHLLYCKCFQPSWNGGWWAWNGMRNFVEHECFICQFHCCSRVHNLQSWNK